MVSVLCGCIGDLDFLAARKSFLFSLMFVIIIEDFLSLGSELRPFLSGKIALCVSNIDTVEYFLTIYSMCLSYIAAANVGLPRATTYMRSWMNIREDMINMCTEVSYSVIEVGTVDVATNLDASSEMHVIFIDLLQQSVDRL